MNGYIVVEGPAEAALVSRLLPDDLSNSVFVANANGRSSAISLCVSLLVKRQKPAVLLVDSDTVEERSIQEQRIVLKDLLSPAGGAAPFLVALAVPEIEILLFSDLEGLEKAIGIKSTEREAIQAEFRPKKILKQMIDRSSQIKNELELISKLDSQALRPMAGHPLMLEITEFFRSQADFYPEEPIPQTGT